MSAPASAVHPEKCRDYRDWLRVLVIGGVFLAGTSLLFTGGNWLILRSDIVKEADHTILPFGRFYTIQRNDVRIRARFANLITDLPLAMWLASKAAVGRVPKGAGR